jgi:leucyl/phenylalanyl-tRNA--protein transferase
VATRKTPKASKLEYVFMPIFLPPNPSYFPNINQYVDNDGLLAYGADLSPKTLLKAYSAGIFPWYNEDENSPILWWSPEPRCVIYPHLFKASRSLQKTLKAHIIYHYC